MADFKLIGKLGEGGMGVVYRANQTSLDREVAIKFLPEALSADETYVSRFRREVKVYTRLSHPNIVKIMNFGKTGGQLYFVMELVKGRTLREFIVARAPLRLKETIAIIRQLLDALDYCHERGIIHRDVKPANVMVDDDGHLTLMDFGLARAQDSTVLTRQGKVLGTPTYMAPEIFLDRGYSPASDVWAAGILAYEMIIGQRPFQEPDLIALVQRILHEEIPDVGTLRPNLPQGYQVFLKTCLTKEPDDRYPDAGAALRALDRIEEAGAATALAAQQASRRTRTVPSGRPLIGEPSDRPLRGPREYLAALLLLVVPALAFLGFMVRARGRTGPGPVPASAIARPDEVPVAITPRLGGFEVEWASTRAYRGGLRVPDALGPGSDLEAHEEEATHSHRFVVIPRAQRNVYDVVAIDDRREIVGRAQARPAPLAVATEKVTNVLQGSNLLSDLPRFLHEVMNSREHRSEIVKKWKNQFDRNMAFSRLPGLMDHFRPVAAEYFQDRAIPFADRIRMMRAMVETRAALRELARNDVSLALTEEGLPPPASYGLGSAPDPRPAESIVVRFTTEEEPARLERVLGGKPSRTLTTRFDTGMFLLDREVSVNKVRSLRTFTAPAIARFELPEPLPVTGTGEDGLLEFGVEVRGLADRRYLVIELAPDGQEFRDVAFLHELVPPSSFLWGAVSPGVLGRSRNQLAIRIETLAPEAPGFDVQEPARLKVLVVRHHRDGEGTQDRPAGPDRNDG